MSEQLKQEGQKNVPQLEAIEGFELNDEQLESYFKAFKSAMPDVDWNPDLEHLVKKDLQLLTQSRVPDIVVSSEDKEKQKNRKGWDKFMNYGRNVFKLTLAHDVPDDKAYADPSNKKNVKRPRFFWSLRRLICGVCQSGII